MPPTVSQMKALKGKRQILTVHVDTPAEASAAAEAGIDMFTFEFDARFAAVRAAATDVFIQAGYAQGHMASEEIAIREGFRALEAGVDAIYFAGSLRLVEAMAREGIPVTGHIGYVPRWRTWTGTRAVGKTAECKPAVIRNATTKSMSTRQSSPRSTPLSETIMTIRLAIIGAGIMGADHARLFAEDIPGASLQVICDASVERAKAVADRYGADVANDPVAAISRPDVDAVVIAAPDPFHAPLSRACIAAGKRVLCEKPLSQSSAECLDVMADEQAKGRRFVQLGFMRRFDQSYIEMKAALDQGRIGRALMMHNFHRNVETPSSDFTGAMAITSSAPHEYDVVRYVLGTNFTAISAFQPKRSDAVVAPVMMVLETADQQLVNIEINNNAAYGYDVRAELVGEKGAVAMHHVAYSQTDSALGQHLAYDADWRGRYAEAYRRQNKAFLKFVNTGLFPQFASDAWDGYAAAMVGEAGVRALASGSRASIELIQQPAFYTRKGA